MDTGYTFIMYNNDCVFTSMNIIVVLHSQYLADVSTRPKNFFTFCLIACDGPKQSNTRSEEQILNCSTATNWKSELCKCYPTPYLQLWLLVFRVMSRDCSPCNEKAHEKSLTNLKFKCKNMFKEKHVRCAKKQVTICLLQTFSMSIWDIFMVTNHVKPMDRYT